MELKVKCCNNKMGHNTNDSKTLIPHYLFFSELVLVLVLCQIRVTDMWHVDIRKSSTSKTVFGSWKEF